MNDRFESDERLRREVIDSLYHSLIYDWDIPEHIRDRYGLTRDYQLYHRLSAMNSGEYRMKRRAGELPDIWEVDARLTRMAEAIFESVCPRPPAEYLDRLNGELENLGRIAASPDSVHDILHIHPAFLAKYGIDRNSSATERSCQAEKAYRELDARFVKMTGRRPYADEFFASLRQGKGETADAKRSKQVYKPVLRNPPSKGRKMRL